MHSPKSGKLYVPALTIVAVVILLLILIGVSTYRHLNTNREMALRVLHRQGAAMIQALEAGARAAMLSPGWQSDAIKRLVAETGKHPEIAYLYLLSSEGDVIYAAAGDPDGNPPRTALHPGPGTDRIRTRLVPATGRSRVYELSKRFTPFPPKNGTPLSPQSAGLSTACCRWVDTHAAARLVLGLKMESFDVARKADLHHAAIMTGILVALAAGAVFFMYVIQNYYRLNRTLVQTRDYIRQVVDHMANGLLSVDMNGEILTHNRLAVELLALNPNQLSGKPLHAIPDLAASGVTETLSRGTAIFDREIARTASDQTRIPLAVSSTPIMDASGNRTGAVILLRDLREIKALEARVKRTEKLAAVGRLAAAVAHEIRNPLSSIRGFAQFLAHLLKDRPEDHAYAAVMVKEVDRINRVVTDLLTFARPLESNPASTPLPDLFAHVIRLMEGDARARGITLHPHLPAGMPPLVLDENQMTQVLLNLVLNALQSMDAGGRIVIGAEPGPGDKMDTIFVSDDGPGIPPAEQERIFDPFFTTREKGTGLGLAIVRKIVENHGGAVRLKSPPEGRSTGCRFEMRLPRHPRPKEAPDDP